jgi:hypothetical protein
MRFKTVKLAAAGLAFVAAPALLALEPTAEDEIVVSTSRKAEEKAVSDLARAVTGRMTATKPIERFHLPLCLAISGVNERYAYAFADRILANARRAGVPLGNEGCKANALVIFTRDSRKELEQARRTNRSVFGTMKPYELKAMLESRDPAFAWRATEILGTNGLPILNLPTELPENRTTEMAGRLRQPAQINVAGAVVMIDQDAAMGKTAQQLADYATLRLLAPTAEVREPVPGAPETIMTLFLDPTNAPAGLTEFDLALLDGVYTIPANGPATKLYGVIRDRLVRSD